MRRQTKQIWVGDVPVGGGAPVAVQSMCITDTRDAKSTVDQILSLERAGCEIVRVAVPDPEAAEALPAILKGIHIPLVADIHFDHRLALAASEAGVQCVRINPGNIGDMTKVQQVVEACKAAGQAMRIGVNAGSLDARRQREIDKAVEAVVDSAGTTDETQAIKRELLTTRMADLAAEFASRFEDWGFTNFKISLKASDVPTALGAYRKMSQRTDYPLHIGITESGTLVRGSIRSSVGLGILLAEGIGDTMRVSLAAPPEDEVMAAFEILKALDIRQRGATLIACPSCGRTEIDLLQLATQVEKLVASQGRTMKIAVMGCVVNGPGEARDADVGIAGGKGKGVIFRQGKISRTVPESEMLSALCEEIQLVFPDVTFSEELLAEVGAIKSTKSWTSIPLTMA